MGGAPKAIPFVAVLTALAFWPPALGPARPGHRRAAPHPLAYTHPRMHARTRPSTLLHPRSGTVTIGILPVATFCSGHTYFVQRMPQRRGVLPYSVHTTFQYSGAIGMFPLPPRPL